MYGLSDVPAGTNRQWRICHAAPPNLRAISHVDAAPAIADAGRITLGGGFRLPAADRTADQARIRLGGGFRLPAGERRTTDLGKIRLGGGFRLRG